MHKLSDLPYDYDALEPHMDAQTMKIHHTKHHQGYVNKLNAALEGEDELLNMDIAEILADIEQIPEEVRQAVINTGGGHMNHNLFWSVMSPDGGGKPTGRLAEALDAAYGSFEDFVEEFNTAAATRFGSGWAWLVVTPEGNLDVFSTPNQDSPLLSGDIPILCLDVWEHAYYLKYQNKRPEFVNAFWNVVNWKYVGELYESLNK